MVNTNDASTGHKLQGMLKDVITVTSWLTGFKNWEYVVLSRARTLSDLYLVEPIDMNKSFKPSNELKRYIEFTRLQESNLFKKNEWMQCLQLLGSKHSKHTYLCT